MATSWEPVEMLILGKAATHIDMGVVKCENILDEIECELGLLVK
jgi:hypothetical protein